MVILVPEAKRVANLAKHGLDMADFEDAFSWHRFAELPAAPSLTGRTRVLYVGQMQGRMVTAVVSPTGSEGLAIVSLRPASIKERKSYDALSRLDEGS